LGSKASPRLLNAPRQSIFSDFHIGPQRVQQLVLGHQMTLAFEQVDQRVIGLGAQVNLMPLAGQSAIARFKGELAEAVR
jgi:hypothetical protein